MNRVESAFQAETAFEAGGSTVCQSSSYCLSAQIHPSLPYIVILELDPVNNSLLLATSRMLALSVEGNEVILQGHKDRNTLTSLLGSDPPWLIVFNTGASSHEEELQLCSLLPCSLLPFPPLAVALRFPSDDTLWQWWVGLFYRKAQSTTCDKFFCLFVFATSRLHVSLVATPILFFFN